MNQGFLRSRGLCSDRAALGAFFPGFLNLLRSLLDWAGGEVALLGADVVAGVECLEVDGAEGAVHLEVCRAVDEVVLAAELLFDVAEADGDVFELDRVEGLAAGGLGDLA